MKFIYVVISLLAFSACLKANERDSVGEERFSIHAQTTIIKQYKAGFGAKYSGENSLSKGGENQNSLTASLYLGFKPWKNAGLFINPEMAGGSGLSGALGVAAATNGETFRVGDPAPKLYLARLFFSQKFALSKKNTFQETDANQLAGAIPEQYISVTAGQIGVADYFDDNKFSHDPRTQFLSWGLMDNGAWDYAANTRGYTPSIVIEYVSPKNEIRYSLSLLPKTANDNDMNWNLSKARSGTLEYTHRFTTGGQNGAFRILAFYNTANMGNYRESLSLSPSDPDITQTRKYGRSKFGMGFNAEQNITDETGCFFRASFNDGRNETWCFTEIDRTASAGLVTNGSRWKRANDNLGIAYVISGLSSAHREYLKAGGKGFILGDGNLNYGPEHLGEIYYSMECVKHIFISGAYQIIFNPGYNRDRSGPVNVFSVRLHIEI